MTRAASQLMVTRRTLGAACVLTIDGVLDSSTYLELRNRVIEAAVDGRRAVLVDVTALDVPTPSAWSVFTSARWHVSRWPDVPVVLVCEDGCGPASTDRNGIEGCVPVHPTIEAALGLVTQSGRGVWRDARAQLPASPQSLRQAREFVAQWMTEWSQAELITVATVVVNVFVENVIRHTDSAPVVLLETDGATITVAVRDSSCEPAVRRECADPCRERVSGLAIVAAVCRTWGSMPTSSGKLVWAVIGPENRL